jgi:aspartyl-tRNA(Asn)/glutamyl-tRNA(Gln) amidotransferase subunit A
MMHYQHVRTRIEARKEFCASLVAGTLERVTREGACNAFVELFDEEARAAAAESDARVRAGHARALEGMLLGVKDNICIEGRRATAASHMLENHRAVYDATVVARLRDAGAVIVGRCNMDEFAMGSSGETSVYGPTLHPFLANLVPGGSSSGSAAAVAAGLVHGALGSDTGGSVRQPAAYTGTVGLKPTWGRVSRSGLIAFASSCDQVGPITADVRDNARILSVIAGADPHDATTACVPVDDYAAAVDRGVAGLRIGIPREYMGEEVPEFMRVRVRRVAGMLRDAGAELRELSLPHSALVFPAYFVIANVEASSNLARYDGVRLGRRAPDAALRESGDAEEIISPLLQRYRASRGSGFGREVQRRILLGTQLLEEGEEANWYDRARRVRLLLREEFAALFRDTDVLLTPVTPGPPFAFGARLREPLHMYLTDLFNTAANLTGIPAVSVPAGTDAQGRPVAVQFMAGAFRESTLYAAAGCVERLFTAKKANSPGGSA